MKARLLLPMFVWFVCLTGTASGQRTLQSDEILQIFEKLTSQPRKTWIPAGTIEATHRERGEAKTIDPTAIGDEINRRIQEYRNNPNKVEQTDELQKMKLAAIPFNVRFKLANTYSMDSTVIVKYDGQRFYWQTDIDSRRDSVTPDSTLAGNFMTEQIDLDFNRKTISAWNGQEYITCTVSGRCATVDATGRLPHVVNGPLTAGVVPWGYGRFAYASLSQAAFSATEIFLDGESRIQMTLDWPDGSSASFTLDPSRNYAVTACTLPEGKNAVSVNNYADYKQVAGNWVPSAISMERRDSLTNRLLGSDQWTFVAVDGTVPGPGSFTVNYEPDTFIQFMSALTDEPTTYLYSSSLDTDRLLADRLAYLAAQGKQPQNCATAAVGYVASRLGKTAPAGALASLVAPNGQTTMYQVKQLVQDLGLYCRAVRADPATLRNMGPAKAIVHIPGKNHFVVLDSADDRRIRVVDLSNRMFCYSDNLDTAAPQSSRGLALLVSTTPLTGPDPGVDDARLTTILGGSGYTCTKVVQTEYWYYCSGLCDDYFVYYWKRYGCEPAETGSCYDRLLVRYQESPCVPDPLEGCTVTGEWFYAYMPACN